MSDFEMITSGDIAKIIGIKEATIKLWARDGKIPCYKIGSLYKFDRKGIMKWIESKKISQI